MKKTLLPFALFALLLSSCCEDSGDLFWNVVLPDTPPTACDSTKATPFDRFTTEGYLPGIQAMEGSNILLTSPKALYWTDLNTGVLLRKIESQVAGRAFGNTDAIYRFGELAVAASNTGLAAFNLKTGVLAWERALGDCDIDLGVFGTGNQYFVTRKIMEPDGVTAEAVFAGNVQEQNRLDLLFKPAYSHTAHNWAGYGQISAVAPFDGTDGHVYILVAFFEPRANSNALDNFIGLYDVTARAWAYERSPVIGRLPNVGTSIRHLVVSGASAYIGFEDKLIQWDLAEGMELHSITLPMSNNTAASIRDLWASDRYMIVETNNSSIQVLNSANMTVLYNINHVSGTAQASFDTDRIWVTGQDFIDVYALSTGRKMETIVAPCEGFSENAVVWKDAQGYLKIAVAGGVSQRIYRYNLQR